MNNPLINPGLGTFVWMLLAFAILVFILAKWGWPMLLKALKEREVSIENSLSEAEKARQEMLLLKSENQDLLREAKVERDEMLRNARLASDKILEEARLKATEEADRIVESARENINYEKLKAMHELKNEVANLSIEIAEKLIRQELSDKEKANEVIRLQLEQLHLQ